MRIMVLGIRGLPNTLGGAENHSEELYKRLAKKELDITVTARSFYFAKKNRHENWEGIRLLYLWAPKNKNFETIFHVILSLWIALIKQPDVVHVHSIGPALVIPILKLFGIKTVMTHHSINYQHEKWNLIAKQALKWGEYIGLKMADRVIVISKANQRYLQKKYNQPHLFYIPNGINPPNIRKPGITLKQFNISPKKYVLAVSRFVPEKGLHDLLSAYSNIKNPPFDLVIAGSADYKTKYSSKIEQTAQKNPKIILTGFLSGKALEELYSNAGLYVLPSYYEGMPLTLLEALVYGLPVLVSSIPQTRDFKLPEYRYFPPGKIKILENKLLELYQKGISKNEKRKQKEMMNRDFNWDQISEKTHQIYQSLII
ncbi:MAG: glycosyltransferase [Candidatus Aminicenantes bacterium]|nr:glycosyltransferase [Candidatus Aminicenantes bacterium]